jgi:LysM repeat protein
MDLFSQEINGTSSQDSQDLYFAWSSESEVQQLRWRHQNQLISLIYLPRQNLEQSESSATNEINNETLQVPLVSKYDLIGIASGVKSLQDLSATEQIMISYTVKPGDTCTSIANRYNTTIENLIKVNNLSENCDVILIDQTLQVPLSNERLTLTEADLNCDGRIERIRYIPVPNFLDSVISYGFILDTLSDTGLYETVWQYTVADMGAEFMIRPQLLTVDGCQQLLAVNLMPVVAGQNLGLNIFRWDGEAMYRIFVADGWLQTVTNTEAEDLILTTLELEFLPGTSSCNRTNVTYTWNSDRFIETARSIEENGSCELR